MFHLVLYFDILVYYIFKLKLRLILHILQMPELEATYRQFSRDNGWTWPPHGFQFIAWGFTILFGLLFFTTVAPGFLFPARIATYVVQFYIHYCVIKSFLPGFFCQSKFCSNMSASFSIVFPCECFCYKIYNFCSEISKTLPLTVKILYFRIIPCPVQNRSRPFRRWTVLV